MSLIVKKTIFLKFIYGLSYMGRRRVRYDHVMVAFPDLTVVPLLGFLPQKIRARRDSDRGREREFS